MEFLERPPRYRGPNLDPAGARLRPKRLAEGVYALMAFPPPRDNSGLIVGQHGALVIDAGINTAMAHQIQQTVRRLTDRPILWLANTVYHGDHTFGNAAFPAGTKIIASRQTAQSMTDVDAEKRARAQNLDGNLDAIAEVTSWRRPDVVFDDHTEVDLSGRIVQRVAVDDGGAADARAWILPWAAYGAVQVGSIVRVRSDPRRNAFLGLEVLEQPWELETRRGAAGGGQGPAEDRDLPSLDVTRLVTADEAAAALGEPVGRPFCIAVGLRPRVASGGRHQGGVPRSP
jgi:hypothetical protein